MKSVLRIMPISSWKHAVKVDPVAFFAKLIAVLYAKSLTVSEPDVILVNRSLRSEAKMVADENEQH